MTRRFLVTEEQYQQMHDAQEGRCAICGDEETMVRNGRALPLAVDHDHANGLVRGLLCHRCNCGLGYFRDDPDRLRGAQEYLTRYSLKLSAFCSERGVGERSPHHRTATSSKASRLASLSI